MKAEAWVFGLTTAFVAVPFCGITSACGSSESSRPA